MGQLLLSRLRSELESLRITGLEGDDAVSVDLSLDGACALALELELGAGENRLAASGAAHCELTIGSGTVVLGSTQTFAALELTRHSDRTVRRACRAGAVGE